MGKERQQGPILNESEDEGQERLCLPAAPPCTEVGFQVPGSSLPILILMLEERGIYLATFFSSWKRPFSGIYLC